MALRPIFAATHPRACSTAFERVFMTRRDILESVHEPFGDAFYYGPEFLSDRFRDDAATRESSGFSDKTYKDILESIMESGKEGKRIFIKDMAYYLMKSDSRPTQIAPSLGEDELDNPTVLPLEVLKQFQFTFLIRHPRRAIPSYYRCTVPPLDEVTGFYHFMPNEAGYEELVTLFDFLLENGIVNKDQLVVVDADDLLDNPEKTIRLYCEKTGIDFKPEMLDWNESDKSHASNAFEKWNGFHNDAIKSTSLKPRTHAQKTSTTESEDKDWTAKWGPEAQKLIRQTVNDNVARYEYLKQFALEI
ncbi:P-loop containing nucleoside triphosphate hydrolase protein [Dactylonectria macrodidyma]|uniref:P-loop containing nucleoside triphosphate hydrolase protein n=1 Tax=Dactylonectria macrodidyma TaxID=307937 RepID=A0A9P9ESU6_9HYPO|nr:P-loop containing nucleoside triphosphate hydrolase protein [Dactylonectria macrodidyma]